MLRFPSAYLATAITIVAIAAPGRFPFPGGPAPARGDVILNEVLYDPAGPDDGAEFVELWNPDSTAAALDGLSIEAGDGARPDLWTPIWRAPLGIWIGPKTAFLVAGGALTGVLQNGPDAVRLLRGASVLDLLGYGDLPSPSSYEGAPAADPPSGVSLARVEDGVDTNVNRDDWRAEGEPTPGLANHPPIRLRITREGVVARPEVAWPGEPVALRLWIRNAGRLAVDGARWSVEVALRRDSSAGAWQEAASLPGGRVAPAESTLVLATMAAPSPGAWSVRVRVRDQEAGSSADGEGSAGDGADLADTATVAIRSGPGPAIINEIAFRDAGAGEWVEIFLRESIADLGELSLADASSIRRPIDRGALPRGAAAGSYRILAQDPARVRTGFGLPDSLVLGVTGGWPLLNDTGEPGEPADRVRLLDAGLAPLDAAGYEAERSARGGSLERLSPDLPSDAAGSWAETIDPAKGTPGRANSMRAPGDRSGRRGPLLVAGARVLRRAADAAPVVFRVTLEARGRRLTVRVHDLLGRPLRTLVEGQRFASEGAFLWDGKDDRGVPMPPGIYVIRAEALAEQGVPARASTLPLAIAAERAR